MPDSNKREPNAKSVLRLPLLNWRLDEIESGAYYVQIELAVVDGNLACTSFSVLGYDPDVGFERSTEVGAVWPVNATVMRQVRVAHAVDGAISSHRMERRALSTDISNLPETADEFVKELGLSELIEPKTEEDERRRRVAEAQFELERSYFRKRHDLLAEVEQAARPKKQGRPPIADAEVREAAAIYEDAVRSGVRFPSKEVAEQMNLSSNQARRRIVYARERGYLPPTDPGRAHA